MKERIAIIGTGIAGLGCAHFLHSRFDLTLFEQNDYIGGHTNTVEATERGKPVPIDTGFMVFNHVTYPNLLRLFRELDVATKRTEMSFSVQHGPTGIEYNGMGVNKVFAQRSNLLRPRFWRFIGQIQRFFREAIRLLDDPNAENISLAEFVSRHRFSEDFVNLYLVPMGSAVWSTPPKRMLDFPARTLLRFFHNHGFLGVETHHPWWTVSNGSREYVRKLVPPFQDRIRLSDPAEQVHRSESSVEVVTRSGERLLFDRVILAAHADQSLRLLVSPTPSEQKLLAPFQYQTNIATLHTDTSVMPKRRLAWASWNYRIEPTPDGQFSASTHYWMNALQQVSEHCDYFVTINGEELLDPSKILKRIVYEHPTYDVPAIQAQKLLPSLNKEGHQSRTFFCGSYFQYGFHEDAFTSALHLCRELTGEPIWQ